MVIEISTRDGNRGYVQVRAKPGIASDTWTITRRQELRVLRTLGAPVGDGLLSGRYVAMIERNGDNIPLRMDPSRGRGYGYMTDCVELRA